MRPVLRGTAAAGLVAAALAWPVLAAPVLAVPARASASPVEITPNPSAAGTSTPFAVNCNSLTAADVRLTAIGLALLGLGALSGAVFYDLGRLRAGDRVDVTLADRRTAVFRAYGVGLYPETDFPSRSVYGYTRWPTLRLVTCGGGFDRHTGQYLGNVVVFAEYVGQAG